MPKNGKPIHRKKSTTQGRNITSRWSSSTKYFLGANKADRFSRTDLIFLCVFPIMFLLFNIAYWTAIYFWRWGEGREAFNDEWGSRKRKIVLLETPACNRLISYSVCSSLLQYQLKWICKCTYWTDIPRGQCCYQLIFQCCGGNREIISSSHTASDTNECKNWMYFLCVGYLAFMWVLNSCYSGDRQTNPELLFYLCCSI